MVQTRSIVIATLPSDDPGPLLQVGSFIAARTRGTLDWRMLDGEGAAPRGGTAATAELVLVDPRYSSHAGVPGLDPAIRAAIPGWRAPVLAVRDADAWPPRRVVVAFDDADLRERFPGRAYDCAAAAGALDAGRGPVSLRMLYVSRDPDAMHRGIETARDEVERIRAEAGARSEVTLTTCVRWGAAPHRRVLGWLDRDEAELVVLSGGRPGSPAGQSESWVRVLGDAACSVLVLPGSAAERSWEAEGARRWRGLAGWWAGVGAGARTKTAGR